MRKKLHLMVVDDEPTIREVCVDLLRSEGYSVVTANNGREAVEMLTDRPADLVLMDATMPGIDGIAACRLLKSNARTRHIPIVIMSAAGTTIARLAAVQGMIVAFLPKPFDLDQLLDTVKQFAG